jgi:hypothetical protein
METTERDPAVLGLLLQRHTELLRRGTLGRLVNRVLLFAITLLPILHTPLSPAELAISLLPAFVVAYLWRVDSSQSAFQLLTIEETLARFAGGDLEDVYIRARSLPMTRIRGETQFEPFVWLAAALMANLGMYLVRISVK